MINKEKAITPIKSLRTSAQQILLQVMDPLIIANSFVIQNCWHLLMFKKYLKFKVPLQLQLLKKKWII